MLLSGREETEGGVVSQCSREWKGRCSMGLDMGRGKLVRSYYLQVG